MNSSLNSSPSFNFDEERFNAPPSEVLPWCQMINPQFSQTGLKPYGLAISEENARSAGVTLPDFWERTEYVFGSGEIVNLYISKTPRLVVVRRGPVSIKDRESNVNVGRLSDHYEAYVADRLKFKTYTRYLIFLVGEEKSLLHTTPIRITLSGAAGASFGISYGYRRGLDGSGFTIELEKAYAEFKRQPALPKSPLFHAHGIFCPIIDAVEKGSGVNTALVATTVDYGHPTSSTLMDYLIPSNSEESKTICQAFEEYKDFGMEAAKSTGDRPETSSVTDYSYQEEYDFGEPPY